MVLLLAGVLYHQRIERVDAMMAAVLDRLGKKPSLADPIQCGRVLDGSSEEKALRGQL